MERILAIALIGILVCSQAMATSVWSEASDGDLSSDPAAPTALTFAVGENTVSGSVVSPADVRDYMTFSVPSGHQLVEMQLLSYFDVDNGGPGNTGYHSLNLGTSSVIPSGATADDFLGGDHLSELPSGTNVLEILGSSPLNGTGFSPPLGEGDYTYLVQQTGPQHSGYEVSFTLAAIPEPSSSLLMLMSCAALFAVRGRRR